MHERPEFLAVRGKLLHFPSLAVPLRLIAGLGIAQVAVAVFLLLLRDVPFPVVIASMYQNQPLVIRLPFLFVGTSLLMVDWTYLLAGILRTHWWVAFPVLLLVTLGLGGTDLSAAGWPLGPLAMVLAGVRLGLPDVGRAPDQPARTPFPAQRPSSAVRRVRLAGGGGAALVEDVDAPGRGRGRRGRGQASRFFDENLLPPFGLFVLGVPVLLYHWAVVGRRRWVDQPVG